MTGALRRRARCSRRPAGPPSFYLSLKGIRMRRACTDHCRCKTVSPTFGPRPPLTTAKIPEHPTGLVKIKASIFSKSPGWFCGVVLGGCRWYEGAQSLATSSTNGRH
ncbi:hypothetical protein BV25DRAFT_1828547 [Artomyces pyxidatus]|uniref:Uncharacterized protein n=1 Tax=Artomyces pyxidatus TaxID=48021 RepID=A0ACB8STZ0_9AGAM|nr:hypothetical protein BV25DRAFT_1828547 [Artomyces pyxidatus]